MTKTSAASWAITYLLPNVRLRNLCHTISERQAGLLTWTTPQFCLDWIKQRCWDLGGSWVCFHLSLWFVLRQSHKLSLGFFFFLRQITLIRAGRSSHNDDTSCTWILFSFQTTALDLTASLAQALFGAKIICYKICLIENRSAVARVRTGRGREYRGRYRKRPCADGVLLSRDWMWSDFLKLHSQAHTMRACEKWWNPSGIVPMPVSGFRSCSMVWYNAISGRTLGEGSHATLYCLQLVHLKVFQNRNLKQKTDIF